MKKRIAIILGVTVLLLGGAATAYLQKRATVADYRHKIFCERLTKGMNKEEVLSALNEFGEFEYGVTDWGESYSEIFGNYATPSIIGQTTVHIMFAYGKYTNAYVENFSEPGETICSP